MKSNKSANRIERCFSDLRLSGRKALIPFLVAGDPSLEATRNLALTLLNNGADLLEIGVPFSDPSADGPHIMAADARALAGGTRLEHVFELLADLRRETEAPLLLLLYFNLIYQQGVTRFFEKCREAGVDGVIVPDLPYEEMADVLPAAEANNVILIRMATPLSGARLPDLTRDARGFLYCVAALGVTGERSDFGTDLKAYSDTLAAATRLPRALGFGISTPEQIRRLASDWDALIVGSAIVRRIAEGVATGLSLDVINNQLASFCKEMRLAIDHTGSAACSPSREDFSRLHAHSRLIPVTRRMTSDTVTPISLFRRFDDQTSAWLLESVVNGERWARYSIMGRRPLLRLACRGGNIQLTDGDGHNLAGNGISDSPVDTIRTLLKKYQLPDELAGESFRSGLVGYFAYDFVRYLEKLPDNNPDELDLPDCDLMAPGEVVVFDHLKSELTLVCNIPTSSDPDADYQKAADCLDILEDCLFGARDASCPSDSIGAANLQLDFQPNVSREEYIAQVISARDYIKAGDVFQVVLSQRFSAEYHEDPFAVYRRAAPCQPIAVLVLSEDTAGCPDRRVT